MLFNYDVLFFFEEFVLLVDMFGVKLFGNLLQLLEFIVLGILGIVYLFFYNLMNVIGCDKRFMSQKIQILGQLK